MNQLEDRLRAAGRSHVDPTPDIDAIKRRGRRIRRNRQIGTTAASVALVAIGGVAAINLVRPSGTETVISASEGETADDGNAVEQTDSTEQNGDANDDATPTSTLDEAEQSVEAEEVEPDGGTDGEATDDAEDATTLVRPTAESLSDGGGGWLTATSAGIAHLRADGSETLITMPNPPGGFAQRWPSDVVDIGGRRYLLIDQFVNREDLATERVQALADQYGLTYDPDADMVMELFNVATPRETAELEHWEVGIVAVDLETGEWRVVENRIINSATSPDWVYNGHITARDDVILVMRELWQSQCMYVEGLTLDGEPVAVRESEVYGKPAGIDDMTFDDVVAVFDREQPTPQPCHGLDEVADGGRSFLGTQADPIELDAFGTAFFEAGLG